MTVTAGLARITLFAMFLAGDLATSANDVRAQGLDAVAYSGSPDQKAGAGESRLGRLTKKLSEGYDYLAPDGSEVRLLVRGERASMAQFKLPVGHTSAAVAHHSVEELWYVVSGSGQMWRKLDSDEQTVIELEPGVSVVIPPGTHFQFRSTGLEALEIVGVTVPAWPGAEEAYTVDGKWPVTAPGN